MNPQEYNSDAYLKAEELFLKICELPAQEREQEISALAIGDEALASDMRSLIAHDAKTDVLLDSPTFVEGSRNECDLTVESFQNELDTDRYRILRFLGEGGMGIVFLAEQLHPVKRNVAIKVLRYGREAKHIIRRFEAERQALAVFDHPNLNQLFDGGISKQGRPYFVMDFVDGTPVTEFCRKEELSLEQVLMIFSDVCETIQHAHEKGIIHRDIKPANILVVKNSESSFAGRSGYQVKVIDFGIAKSVDRHPAFSQSFVTKIGDVIGTPQYMSPEQAESGGEDVGIRSDIYSLGVLLYELISGSTPIRVSEVEGYGWLKTLETIRDQVPVPPSVRALNSHVENYPVNERPGITNRSSLKSYSRRLKRDLDWIALKALAKDPRQRYDSVALFSQDIARYMNDEPVSAVRPSKFYSATKFIAKYRWSSAIVAFLLIGLCLTAWIGFDQARRSRLALAENSNLVQTLEMRKNELETVVDQFKEADDYRKLNMRIELNDYAIESAIKKIHDVQNYAPFQFGAVGVGHELPLDTPFEFSTDGLTEEELPPESIEESFEAQGSTSSIPVIELIARKMFGVSSDADLMFQEKQQAKMENGISNQMGRMFLAQMLGSNCLDLSKQRGPRFLPTVSIDQWRVDMSSGSYLEQACEYYDMILKEQRSVLGKNDRFLNDTLECKAQMFFAAEEYQSALRCFEVARASHRCEKNEFRLLHVEMWIARTLLSKKDREEYKKLRDEILPRIEKLEDEVARKMLSKRASSWLPTPRN